MVGGHGKGVGGADGDTTFYITCVRQTNALVVGETLFVSFAGLLVVTLVG